jgi:hypothetical protein
MTMINPEDLAKKPRPHVSVDDIENWFTYHPPTPDQILQYTSIRDYAKSFAICILNNVPDSPDRTVAIRKLRECVMTANAAIACSNDPR